VASDGSFAVNVPLAEGANTIIVSAEDAAGNRDSASVTVERTVTPWGTYAIVLVVIALVLAAIAIFRKR
jgi:subtilase family serine protease